MLPRRVGQGETMERDGEAVAAVETARSAAEAGVPKEPEPKKKEEEHISLFWRVFGGTILSIVALVSITLFNNMSSGIAELRAEVGREREARADLVKKDEFNTRTTSQYERLRGIDTIKVELEGMKERVHANAAAVDGVKRDTGAAVEAMKKDAAAATDATKKDAAVIEVLKERIVLLEAVKKDVAALDGIKEKLATATAELKAVRDEVQKVTGDIDRNKAYDLERKAFRDSQYKQIEDTMRDLQKGLQDCREKLARMEGSQPKPPTELPIPFARPPEPPKKPAPEAKP